MGPALDTKQKVREFIKEHTVTYKFSRQPQRFLPIPALDAITKREVIRNVLEQDEKIDLSDRGHDELVDRVYDNGRKLFATCVMCGKTKYLKAMLDNGLTDADLPLDETKFGMLAKKEEFVTNFMENQKRFKTIFFRKDDIQNLDDDHSDRFTIPIHFEEKEEYRKGKGSFGEVWIVKIHPDHRSFLCETDDDNRFAMKVTQHEGRERNYHSAMAGLNHPHLVKCLTSFTLGPKYQMIYDLADRDLEGFICENFNGGRVPGLTASWLAQQLAGLAGALQVVHNPKGSKATTGASTLNVPSTVLAKTGYIHDIKPENILVFRNRDGTYWLRLSDFSCAKVADFESTISGKRRSYKTQTQPGTPTYRAPESLKGGTSRPYDIWTLGCVYLEVLVWFIEGYEALASFRDAREDQAHPDHPLEDEGFYREAAGVVQLRQPVIEKIEYLSHRCEGGLKDILDVIPSLLQIKPTDRPKASELVEKLKHLGTGASTTLAAAPSHATSLSVPTAAASNLLGHESDSDSDSGSDFGGLVKITRPSG